MTARPCSSPTGAAAVSKDPYVKFAFKGGKKGDDLKISWVDNKGATDTTTAKIQ